MQDDGACFGLIVVVLMSIFNLVLYIINFRYINFSSPPLSNYKPQGRSSPANYSGNFLVLQNRTQRIFNLQYIIKVLFLGEILNMLPKE